MRWLLAMLAITACVLGCSSTDEVGKSEPKILIGAEGVTIEQIAIYQGPKRVLAQSGQAVASDIPLVQGRQALLRVWVGVPPTELEQR